MAKDYYKMIKALFGFRDKLDGISNSKNQKLVDFLRNTEVNPRDEEQVYPDITEISKSTALPRHKVISLIQELYTEALEYLSYNSLTIKEAIQILYIHFPYDEESTIHKNYKEEAKRMSLWLQVQLPVVPRLGEFIHLNFIEDDIKYSHGCVTEISHEISGVDQRTIIHVHPLKNYFHQWDKMRIRHELDVKLSEARKDNNSK